VALLVAAAAGGGFAVATMTHATSGPGASPAASLSSSAQDAGSQALAYQDRMVAIVKQVSPSVVEIESGSDAGSGVVYDAAGDIITNAHVVGTATSFTVTMSNGDTHPGTLVASYIPDDIAVIRIGAVGATPARFGDSSKLAVGQVVLAIGSPLGLQASATEGIVSALDRQVDEPSGYALPDVIQTSAAINPGSSGGALVDLNGNVVGIPTLGRPLPVTGANADGIGFAISSNRAKTIADQLIAHGAVTDSGRADAGVTVETAPHGALVAGVTAGGAAQVAGIVVGDTITAVDKVKVAGAPTYAEAIAGHHPGDMVTLSILHADATSGSAKVTLGTLPA
jgi:putative serine protease PepD